MKAVLLLVLVGTIFCQHFDSFEQFKEHVKATEFSNI